MIFRNENEKGPRHETLTFVCTLDIMNQDSTFFMEACT